jgi:hypothetical protein
MLVTEFYDGQGFGNQLWCYVATRVLALDKGLGFGIQNPEKFKGAEFLNLDMGVEVMGGSGPPGGPPVELPLGVENYYSERIIRHPDNDVDIRTVDKGLQEVTANTKIDGYFQAEEYILHRKEDIRSWLFYSNKDLDFVFSAENICVINFRGGEYKRIPAVFLRRKYWRDAIIRMKIINPNMNFVVITDDPPLAKKFFPQFTIRHYGIHGDYQAINNAPYLILSNSSFGFFPAWLNSNLKTCIAPKYWAAHNESDGYWALSYNLTRNWIYLDREGNVFDYEQCVDELKNYQEVNKDIYEQKKIVNAFVLVSSFNNDLSWLPRYSDNYFVYEQGEGSGLPPQIDRGAVKFVSNNGSNFKDYFEFIVENYDNLPDVIFLVKGNVFPRHVRQHIFDIFVDRKDLCAIVDRQKHRTQIPGDFFDRNGFYCEINSNWYMHLGLPHKYFKNQNDFLHYFDKGLKQRLYSRFALAGQYVITRDVIRRISKQMYVDLLEIVAQGNISIGYNAECFIVERSINCLWQSQNLLSSENYEPNTLRTYTDQLICTPMIKRLFFTSIGLVSKLISNSKKGITVICLSITNRIKLKRNYWII